MVPKALNLLDLHSEELNAIAHYLPPTSRLRFAQTCRRVYSAVWGAHAQDDLIRRYPLERRVFFTLNINLTSTSTTDNESDAPNSNLRTVPARSRQQHINVAVHPKGAIVAVLPYDNVLRLICPRSATVVSSTPLDAVFANDIWDVSHGLRRPSPRPDAVVYADDAGLDVETCLDFSADGSTLLVSCRQFVQLFTVSLTKCANSGFPEATLVPTTRFSLESALARVGNASADGIPIRGSGGAAALSPDAHYLAWILFVGTPAVVHLCLFHRDDVKSNDWTHVRTEPIHEVWTRRWTALAWARPFFTPNGQHLVIVVNSAHKITRVVNSDGHFRRTKLCRFELFTQNLQNNDRNSSTHWLDLAPEEYPRALAHAVVDALSGHVVHEVGVPFASFQRSNSCSSLEDEDSFDALGIDTEPSAQDETDELDYAGVSCKSVLRMPGLAFNSVHSCPAEATYKALSFGKSRHPWFVSKQPMFSFHFDPAGRRVMLATSPHSNQVRSLSVEPRDEVRDPVSATTPRLDNSLENQYESEVYLADRSLPKGVRPHVFKLMPWRAAFAAVTAFSTSGQWLAGAALLDNDRCCVCVRNVTLREYFGEAAV